MVYTYLQIRPIALCRTLECQPIQVGHVRSPDIHSPILTTTCDYRTDDGLLRCRYILPSSQ